MKDRIPQDPGRVKMTLPDGTVQYVTIERADNPIQVGTPLNKSTLLTDETVASIWADENSLPADPTVTNALSKINEKLINLSRFGNVGAIQVPATGAFTVETPGRPIAVFGTRCTSTNSPSTSTVEFVEVFRGNPVGFSMTMAGPSNSTTFLQMDRSNIFTWYKNSVSCPSGIFKNESGSKYALVYYTINDPFEDYSITIHTVDSSGNPVSGCAVQIGGGDCARIGTTGEYTTTPPDFEFTVTCTSPIDWGASVQTQSVSFLDDTEKSITFTISKSINTTELDVTTSKFASFSDDVEDFDVFVLGAGGGGGSMAVASNTYAVASGGSGGSATTKLDIDANEVGVLQINVGAGGFGAATNTSKYVGLRVAGNGGDSSVISDSGISLIAHGGEGGKGNGTETSPYTHTFEHQPEAPSATGGDVNWAGALGGGVKLDISKGSVTQKIANPGENSTIVKFNESSNTAYGGGGGGASGNSSSDLKSGGTPNGTKAKSSTSNAKAVFGGGGGATIDSYNSSGVDFTAAEGGDGIVSFRWREKGGQD